MGAIGCGVGALKTMSFLMHPRIASDDVVQGGINSELDIGAERCWLVVCRERKVNGLPWERPSATAAILPVEAHNELANQLWACAIPQRGIIGSVDKAAQAQRAQQAQQAQHSTSGIDCVALLGTGEMRKATGLEGRATREEFPKHTPVGHHSRAEVHGRGHSMLKGACKEREAQASCVDSSSDVHL